MPVALERLLADPPLLHRQEGTNTLVAYGLLAEGLRLIQARVGPASRTLETGAGLSTVVFAAAGAQHICITPLEHEVDILRAYCAERGIALDGVRFELGPSEDVLPRLPREPLDLVLIDGRHGMPAPFIDWHYTAGRLAVGGTLIVDDTQIWTCRVLAEFLREEPGWRLVDHFDGRTAVFVRESAHHHAMEWINQPYVVRKTVGTARLWRQRVTHGATMIRHGEYRGVMRRTGEIFKRR